MCIIVTKEKNAKPLDMKVFKNCWDNNPNGAGILFNDGKTSTLIKGIMDKKEFLKKVKEANRKECSFVIHTRIATHGSVKPSNTHPFVSKTLGFAHNGTFNITPDGDTTDSETFFLHTIADKTFEWCKRNKYLLDMATKGCRCVIFDMDSGEMLYLNEKDWVDDAKYQGYKFSNTSYSREPYSFNYTPSCGTRWGGSYYGNDILDDDWYDDMDYRAFNDPYYAKKELEEWKKQADIALSTIKIPGITIKDGNASLTWDKLGIYKLFPGFGKDDYLPNKNKDLYAVYEYFNEEKEAAMVHYPDDYSYIVGISLLRNIYGMAAYRTTYKTIAELDKAIYNFFAEKKYRNLEEKEFVMNMLTNLGIDSKEVDKALNKKG